MHKLKTKIIGLVLMLVDLLQNTYNKINIDKNKILLFKIIVLNIKLCLLNYGKYSYLKYITDIK